MILVIAGATVEGHPICVTDDAYGEAIQRLADGKKGSLRAGHEDARDTPGLENFFQSLGGKTFFSSPDGFYGEAELVCLIGGSKKEFRVGAGGEVTVRRWKVVEICNGRLKGWFLSGA